jgi:hypothetical protein
MPMIRYPKLERPQTVSWMQQQRRFSSRLSSSTHGHIRAYIIATLIAGILLIIVGLLNIRIKIPYNEHSLRPHDVVCSYIPSYDDIHNDIGEVTVKEDGTVVYNESSVRRMEKKEIMTSIYAFALMVSAMVVGCFLVIGGALLIVRMS